MNTLTKSDEATLVSVLEEAIFNQPQRTLDIDGPFGHPTTACLAVPHTFHTIVGVRAGLAAIIGGWQYGMGVLGVGPALHSGSEELIKEFTNSHGITSYFHAGRVPTVSELRNGGAQVIQPDSRFTENVGHYLDDPRPSLWIVYESQLWPFVKRLDEAFTLRGWRVETDYKHESSLLFDQGAGWGLVVRDLVQCSAALAVRTEKGLGMVSSEGWIQGRGGVCGIQYELETLTIAGKQYPSTTFEEGQYLTREEFERDVDWLDKHLRQDYLHQS